ncbi:COMM domain-containing protein 2-like [Procambarus clarkii]|uniref:COMM domain-containing protein 2-like n=1 Tax=Procambarus clarkii TaxID=6728 RepID=UPI0037429081
MSLSLSEEHKRHLSLLVHHDTTVVKEFCRLATQFVKHGVNHRVFTSAATKLGVLPTQILQYHNLEWRFDILVGSRTLSHIAEPLITLELSLDTNTLSGSQDEDGDGDQQSKQVCDKLLLQADPNNLVHMTNILEEALREAHTHHSRRIHRYLK